MADRICLEWAFADEAGLTDIVTAAGNDRIVFPHVDSCVAIIFRMADGTVMGGHATMQIRNGAVGYAVSATDMLTRMLAQANGAAIAQILYVGHPDWNHHVVLAQAGIAAIAATAASNLCLFDDPIDIFVDLGAARLRVQKWVKPVVKRDPAHIPAETGDWEHDEPFVARRTHRGACPCVIL
jgi:hypothetical protein